MIDLFKQLTDDHKNLILVINKLRFHINGYNENNPEPDLFLILNMLEYLRSYPEQYHHPLEEKAYDYLELNNLVYPELIDTIRQQHHELTKLTIELCDLFYSIANDTVIPIKTIQFQANTYVNLQTHHINTENESLFPILAQLDDEAWKTISLHITGKSSPIFTSDETEYASLFKCIDAYIPDTI